MNGKVIATVGLGVFYIGVLGLDIAAKRHAAARSKAKAIEIRTPEQVNLVKEAEKHCDIFKSMMDREAKELGTKIHDWKVANEYDKKRANILAAVDDGIDDFKVEIGYFDKIDELEENFEAGVEAFKNSIDYDSTKSKLESAIEEAKSHYEQQKAAFDLAGDDISDTTMKLRHAAEEAMNTKVKEAKEKITALEKQLEAETDKLKKIKLDGTKGLEEKISKEKIRLDKKQDKDLEKLEQELESAKNDIQKKLRKSRTNEEVVAAESHSEDIRILREQKDLDSKAADDILEAMPKYEKFAEYLKANRVPKFVVVIVSLLPAIPIGYLLYKYSCFVGAVLDAM